MELLLLLVSLSNMKLLAIQLVLGILTPFNLTTTASNAETSAGKATSSIVAPIETSVEKQQEISDVSQVDDPMLHFKPPSKAKAVILTKIGDEKWSRKKAAYPIAGQSVQLKIAGRKYQSVRWYLIFADITRTYKNANHPWEPDPYKWVGLETIAYHRVEMKKWRDAALIQPFQDPPVLTDLIKNRLKQTGFENIESGYYQSHLGTFWFQVEAITHGGTAIRSAGLPEIGRKGISKKVTRISIRESNDFLGYLTSYFNVPGVFGSILYQSKNYIGVDCADVLMAAWAQWKRKSLKKNMNVQMMTGKFKTRKMFRMEQGKPNVRLKWSKDVFKGDFIAVHYGTGEGKFHHVGALHSDKNKNGILDEPDLVIHAGPESLHYSSLGEGAFDGNVVVLANTK